MLTNAASMGTLCLGLPDWWPVNSCGGGGGGGGGGGERVRERGRKGERVSYYIHIVGGKREEEENKKGEKERWAREGTAVIRPYMDLYLLLKHFLDWPSPVEVSYHPTLLLNGYRCRHVAEGRKKERSKQGHTYNKAKQHSTPKAVTFPKKNKVGLEPTTLYPLDRVLHH